MYPMYGFSGEEMATDSSKTDQYVHGDQQEKNLLSSVKDVHYDLIDEKDDYGSSTKLNMHDTTKELLTNESRYNATSGYESSSCTLSIMSIEDNHDDDASMKSVEFSEREVMDKGEK